MKKTILLITVALLTVPWFSSDAEVKPANLRFDINFPSVPAKMHSTVVFCC